MKGPVSTYADRRVSQILKWSRRDLRPCRGGYIPETDLAVRVIVFIQIDIVQSVQVLFIIGHEVGDLGSLGNDVIIKCKGSLVGESWVPSLCDEFWVVPRVCAGWGWDRWRWLNWCRLS